MPECGRLNKQQNRMRGKASRLGSFAIGTATTLYASAVYVSVWTLSPAFAQSVAPTTVPVDLAGGDGQSGQSFLPSVPGLPSDLDPTFALPFDDKLAMADLMMLAAFGGVLMFALITGWLMVRTRREAHVKIRQSYQAIQSLQGRLDQAESLLNAADQLMVIWDGPEGVPQFVGSLGGNTPLPDGNGILAFGNWLNSDCAQQVELAVNRLRATGQRFVLSAETLYGSYVEIRGRTSGARALMQMRLLDGDEKDQANLQHEANRLTRELTRLKGLLEAVPMPVWSRDEEGTLSWVNGAYRQAVEANSIETVLADQTDLLDQRGRDAIREAHQTAQDAAAPQGGLTGYSDIAIKRMPVIIAGKRRIYDVIDIAASQGTVGIATDVSALDATENALTRMQAFHATTLDQLMTPVAIFDSNQQLQFYNAGYADLFELEPSFLDQMPTDSAILDRLRASRQLPEQADFQRWKGEFLSSYRAVEAQEYLWHLPNGLSLRVVAAPNPDGGVTYIYENLTERLDLEKRHATLTRIQRETLDHLNDGVVVFGSNGRVQVSNPAFARLWAIGSEDLKGKPHVSDVLSWCRRFYDNGADWAGVKAAVAGLADKREGVNGRMVRQDERILDYAAIPLPDGATMVTFVDVTDNVKVEQGLMDRNEALLAADQLKNTFIQHVSYELRSPLTNIIGFTELLTSEAVGPLNEKQRDYTDHIMTSSSALQTIVNDILDLATIDAGIMQLELGQVDPVESIRSAAEGLQDRLAEKNLHLNISVDEHMGQFVGDPSRVRQVLYNLISNAIAFSEDSSKISVVADRTPDAVTFAVSDQGCGIPEEFVASAFDRFESRNAGASRRGAGLGLSIVKSFVELHGGFVRIDSREGEGTSVTCHFPITPKEVRHAAE